MTNSPSPTRDALDACAKEMEELANLAVKKERQAAEAGRTAEIARRQAAEATRCAEAKRDQWANMNSDYVEEATANLAAAAKPPQDDVGSNATPVHVERGAIDDPAAAAHNAGETINHEDAPAAVANGASLDESEDESKPDTEAKTGLGDRYGEPTTEDAPEVARDVHVEDQPKQPVPGMFTANYRRD